MCFRIFGNCGVDVGKEWESILWKEENNLQNRLLRRVLAAELDRGKPYIETGLTAGSS